MESYGIRVNREKKQNKTGIPEVHKKLPMLSEHPEEDQS